MRVNLKDVISAIAEADEEVEYYYYIPEERIISRVSGVFTDDEFQEEEPDDDDLIALPDRYEIDEYGIMKDFAESYPEASTKEWLVNSIHGKGAFRRFRAVLERFYITDQWYAFQDEAYRTKAMKWCEDYGIYYASAADRLAEQEPVSTVLPPVYRLVTITKDNYMNIVFLHADYTAGITGKPADPERAKTDIETSLNREDMIMAVSDKGRFIGYGIVRNHTLQSLYIRPEYRNKGVGSLLFGGILAADEELRCQIPPAYLDAAGFFARKGYSVLRSVELGRRTELDNEVVRIGDNDLYYSH